MELTPKRKIELESLVDNFCKETNFNAQKDIVQELKKLDFEIVRAKFRRPMDGMILVDETKPKIPNFNKNKVIVFNDDAPLYFARFILLHELSHYIFEKYKHKEKKIYIKARDHSIGNYSDNIDEQEKDYMAAAMIINRKSLNDFIDRYIEETHCEKESLINDNYFIQAMQKEFKAESICVKRRIIEVLT